MNTSHSDGLIGYQQPVMTTPVHRYWNSSSLFGPNLTAQDVGGAITWNIVRGSKSRDEMIMGTEDQNNDVTIQVYNSTGEWGNALKVTSDIVNSDSRDFDIEYEDISGRALIVYENSSVTDTTFAFRLWNGTSYTAEQFSATGLATSPVRWMRAYPRNGTDEIMVLMLTSTSDISAILWNGTNFTSNWSLTVAAAAVNQQNFDFAWGSSGMGMAFWGSANNFARANYSNGAWSAVTNIGEGQGIVNVKACASPIDDKFAVLFVDSGNDLNMFAFNGSTILAGNPAQDGTVTAPGTNNANLDCIWNKAGTQALMGWVNNVNTSSIAFNVYRTGANNWSNSDLVSPNYSTAVTGGVVRGFQFIQDTYTDEIMIPVMDSIKGIHYAGWNGTEFTNGTRLANDTNVVGGAQTGVGFDFYRYDSPPDFFNVSPNSTVFAVNSNVVINVSVIDNINVSTVFANVTWPNGSFSSLELFNRTYSFYNTTFTSTALIGMYNITFIDNDTAGHVNTVQSNFSVQDTIPPNVTDLQPFGGALRNVTQTIELSANVTDNVAVSSVRANLTYPNGTIVLVTLASAVGAK